MAASDQWMSAGSSSLERGNGPPQWDIHEYILGRGLEGRSRRGRGTRVEAWKKKKERREEELPDGWRQTFCLSWEVEGVEGEDARDLYRLEG